MTESSKWLRLLVELSPQLSSNGVEHDRSDTFVGDNYSLLKENGYLTALIPKELGGGGASFEDMCKILIKIAHACPSTALALSMHQHLIAASIWKYKHEGKAGEFLNRIAEKKLVLVSTGARDWLDSNGNMVKTEGGYSVSGRKHFASQSAIGDVLVTSMPYEDQEEGWRVLHFTLPMNSDGVRLQDDWYTLGMRGTGSQTVTLENVFVPDAAITMTRAKGEFPMFWNVVLTVALPLTMAPYVGIAEKAMIIALEKSKKKKDKSAQTILSLGEIYNSLTSTQVFHNDMVRVANNLDFYPQDKMGIDMLARKTLVANASKETVNKAMGIVGGQSFYRSSELERLFRDVQAAGFHTLPEKQQQQFTGEFLLK